MHRLFSLLTVSLMALSSFVLFGCSDKPCYNEMGYHTCTSNEDCKEGYCSHQGYCVAGCTSGAHYECGDDNVCFQYLCHRGCETDADCQANGGACIESRMFVEADAPNNKLMKFCEDACHSDRDCTGLGEGFFCYEFVCVDAIPVAIDGDEDVVEAIEEESATEEEAEETAETSEDAEEGALE